MYHGTNYLSRIIIITKINDFVVTWSVEEYYRFISNPVTHITVQREDLLGSKYGLLHLSFLLFIICFLKILHEDYIYQIFVFSFLFLLSLLSRQYLNLF